MKCFQSQLHLCTILYGFCIMSAWRENLARKDIRVQYMCTQSSHPPSKKTIGQTEAYIVHSVLNTSDYSSTYT